jgi:hypothetical protein
MMDAQSTAKLDRGVRQRIQDWLRGVRGQHVGEKRRAVYQTIPYEWMDASVHEEILLREVSIETEDMLVLEIPIKELASMADTQDWYKRNIGGYSMEKFDRNLREKYHEEFLREKHPGLQEAWEQYQIMLSLCSHTSYKK